MKYTARKTYVITDDQGNLVPDFPDSPSRAALNAWLAAGNTLQVVDNTETPAPAPSPAPSPSPSPAPVQTPGSLNLFALMNEVYGEGNWSCRTGPGQGSDIAPALVLGCQKLRASGGRGEIVIPPGSWVMNSGIPGNLLSGITIRGYGSMASKVFYNKSSGVAFHWSGDSGFTGGGINGIGILLEGGFGSSSASAILLQGDSSYQPDQFNASDLYITALGDSYWYCGVMAFGNARTAPQGIRVADIRNVQVFKCRNTAWYLSNIVQWSLMNIGAYAGTGTGNNIYIAGGGASNTNSTQISAFAVSCFELNLTNCSSFDMSGKCQQIATNTTATDGDLRFRGASLLGQKGSNVSFNGAI